MAFAYNGRNLRHLGNYTAARKYWEKAPTWRNQQGEHDERVLDNRTKKYIAIRKRYDDAIVCRMHHTDVITYNPDNTIRIVPYQSISTDEFFNNLIGHRAAGLWAEFNRGVIYVAGRYYTIEEALTVRYNPIETSGQRYELISVPAPFKWYVVNRKESERARKEHDYDQFRDWVTMLEKSGFRPEKQNNSLRWMQTHAIVDMLDNREHWLGLLEVNGMGVVDAKATTTGVRDALYSQHPEVYDVVSAPSLESWQEVDRWRRGRFLVR